MKRRSLILSSTTAFVLPSSRANAAERVIGWISPESLETTAPFFSAFKQGLAANPFPDRSTIRIIERYATGGAEAHTAAVADLQQQRVALIVAQGAASVAVVKAKPSVPVVFGFSGDPVVAGLIDSLARPGGNATGVSFMSIELNPKRIDLLRFALPNCRRVALLSNPRHAGEENEIAACQTAVKAHGIELSVYRIQSATDTAGIVRRALDEGAQAMVALPSSFMVQQAAAIATLCLDRKVPLVSGWATFARSGALLTFGPNLQEAYKRVASYVVRVLGGRHPGDLPVEQPAVFELAVNVKAATALGISLPPSLLAQADIVID